MKVRIIKTTAGYIPQVYKTQYGSEQWWSLSHHAEDGLWSDPAYIIDYCTYLTQWGAKRVLKNYLKVKVDVKKRLADFKKELEQPNVVYEAEV
jgi:hypothetical protein